MGPGKNQSIGQFVTNLNEVWKPQVFEALPTLCDRFAMAALTGLLAMNQNPDCLFIDIVSEAFDIAGMCIAERDKRGKV